MSFLVRPLESQKTFGAELRTMRQRLAISLDMAAAGTNIQRRYLEALETQSWNLLPEPIYTRNYLKAYVRFLGGDSNYFLSRFQEERATCDFLGKNCLPRTRIRSRALLATPRILNMCGIGLAALLVLGYLGTQIHGIIRPPSLEIASPIEGTLATTPIVTVAGNVEKETTLFINGLLVLPNPDGTFKAPVTLERGYNIVRIEARRRYSRPITLERTVLFTPESSPQQLSQGQKSWYTVSRL